MSPFDFWKTKHLGENLSYFNGDSIGILWLKTKCIIRKDLLPKFLIDNSIELREKALSRQFVELFDILCKDLLNSHKMLNSFLVSESELEFLGIDTEQLVSELYKLKSFDWGGDYKNSLDKYLVSRYIKTYNSFDSLVSKLEGEINVAVQGYVLNSWYNHWSSILIEHIFKSHDRVLPTVGQVKSVDFFIDDIPFDLKVTFLPVEFIKAKRREKGYPNELSYLKKQAALANIKFDKEAKPTDIQYEITSKMIDRNDSICNSTLEEIHKVKMEILKEAQENPKPLAKWLYENQGEMRFGSENRLFLVLVDTKDFENSWRLKRNLDLLHPAIFSYLDNFYQKKVEDLEVSFFFNGRPTLYKALADIIFIIK